MQRHHLLSRKHLFCAPLHLQCRGTICFVAALSAAFAMLRHHLLSRRQLFSIFYAPLSTFLRSAAFAMLRHHLFRCGGLFVIIPQHCKCSGADYSAALQTQRSGYKRSGADGITNAAELMQRNAERDRYIA